MTDFPYIDCPPGEEQGPAIEGVDPYCLPADEAIPGVPEPTFTLPVAPPYQVGLYLYQKVDPSKPASWSNSGPQAFVTSRDGDAWFTAFPGALPEGVCGSGWAVQQDLIVPTPGLVWPSTITYPNNVLSKAGVLEAAVHADLESLVDVPECVTEEPTPTPVPTVVQPVAPPRELAVTGPVAVDVVLTLIVLAVSLVTVGWLAWKASRRF